MNKFDLITFGLTSSQIKEVEFFCQSLSITYKHYSGAEDLDDNGESSKIILVNSNLKKLSAEIQAVKYFFPETFNLCLIDEDKISEDESNFLKKSGADLVYCKTLFETSSVVHYAILSIIKFALNPIKTEDIQLNTRSNFDAFILLPNNDKTIKILSKDTMINQSEHTRLKKFNELFVKRKDLENFRQYKNGLNTDVSSFRNNLLLSKEKYLMFVLNLFNLLKTKEEISLSLNDVVQNCVWLFQYIKNHPHDVSWNLFDQSLDYQFGPIDHVFNYLYISSKMMERNPECNEALMVNAIVLSQLGLIKLNFKLFNKVRNQNFNFETLEKAEYTKYPFSGLNIFLNNKITIDAEIQNRVLYVTEQFNKQGFPLGVGASSKVPLESKIIRLSKMINDEALVKIGKTTQNLNEALAKIVEQETQDAKVFNPEFIRSSKHLVF